MTHHSSWCGFLQAVHRAAAGAHDARRGRCSAPVTLHLQAGTQGEARLRDLMCFLWLFQRWYEGAAVTGSIDSPDCYLLPADGRP